MKSHQVVYVDLRNHHRLPLWVNPQKGDVDALSDVLKEAGCVIVGSPEDVRGGRFLWEVYVPGGEEAIKKLMAELIHHRNMIEL